MTSWRTVGAHGKWALTESGRSRADCTVGAQGQTAQSALKGRLHSRRSRADCTVGAQGQTAQSALKGRLPRVRCCWGQWFPPTRCCWGQWFPPTRRGLRGACPTRKRRPHASARNSAGAHGLGRGTLRGRTVRGGTVTRCVAARRVAAPCVGEASAPNTMATHARTHTHRAGADAQNRRRGGRRTAAQRPPRASRSAAGRAVRRATAAVAACGWHRRVA